MTAWICLYDKTSSPYTMDDSYRFDVRSVQHAREMAAVLYPDAPELAAVVVLACEYTACGQRMMYPGDVVPTVEAARERAHHPTAMYGGWYRGLYRGKMRDICQWHYEVDPATNRPQKVGTAAAARKAAETAPIGGDQLDLFGGAL